MKVDESRYVGKKLYIGIDVHKTTYSLSALSGGVMVKKATVKADPEKVAESILSWFPGAEIISAYEAGFSGFCLHRKLIEKGISNIVVNPASIAVAANDKVKTDKRDSLKIASQLAAGLLKGIWVPSLAEQQRRGITRTRSQIVEHRASVSNQIKGVLAYEGYSGPDDTRVMSLRLLREIEKLPVSEDIRMELSFLIAQWRFLTTQLAEMKEILLQQEKANPKIVRYRSVPGVGVISAATFFNELGDLSRFKNVKGLYSYTGLTPCEFSSGPHIRRGHISRQGSSRVRHLLVEVAWRAISKDTALKTAFDRIAERRGKKRAIVAIARKLVGRMRASHRDGVDYIIGKTA